MTCFEDRVAIFVRIQLRIRRLPSNTATEYTVQQCLITHVRAIDQHAHGVTI